MIRLPLYEVRFPRNPCEWLRPSQNRLFIHFLQLAITSVTTYYDLEASKSLRTRYSNGVILIGSVLPLLHITTRLIPTKPPPAYFTLYPPTPAADVTTTDTPAPSPTPSASSSTATKNASLISRYGLEARANTEGNSTEFSDKAAWEDSAAKREASLRERKAQMILAARQYAPDLISGALIGTNSLSGACWPNLNLKSPPLHDLASCQLTGCYLFYNICISYQSNGISFHGAPWLTDPLEHTLVKVQCSGTTRQSKDGDFGLRHQ